MWTVILPNMFLTPVCDLAFEVVLLVIMVKPPVDPDSLNHCLTTVVDLAFEVIFWWSCLSLLWTLIFSTIV